MDHTETPVLLLVFNRPDKVRALISALEKVKPKHIYISADGPRPHVPADIQKCQEVRDLVTNLPWSCEIHTNFSDKNLGCKYGPVSGIDWFFSHVTEGIILEDDCIPHPAFFPYITELLYRYRDTKEIMHLSGTTFLDRSDLEKSYYFSRIAHGWGWATWRRAWKEFDVNMSLIDKLHEMLVEEGFFTRRKHSKFWTKLFYYTNDQQSDVWDTQWEYSILISGGICITPAMNMIENIGFDNDATHTKSKKQRHLSHADISFEEVVHPQKISISKHFDSEEMEQIFMPSRKQEILSLFKKCYHSVINPK